MNTAGFKLSVVYWTFHFWLSGATKIPGSREKKKQKGYRGARVPLQRNPWLGAIWQGEGPLLRGRQWNVKGIICPSSSPLRTGFFFMEKKIETLTMHQLPGLSTHNILLASKSWKVSTCFIHPIPIGKIISPSAIRLTLPDSMNIQLSMFP